MVPSQAKRKRFSRLSEEEIKNLVEGKDTENTRKATLLLHSWYTREFDIISDGEFS